MYHRLNISAIRIPKHIALYVSNVSTDVSNSQPTKPKTIDIVLFAAINWKDSLV